MPLDGEFLRAVAPLRSADMGTELMGPLLYSLIRSTRPVRLLEVGMGYTTPFILAALADNAADAERERQALVDKTTDAVIRLSGAGGTERPQVIDDWVRADPALARPAFYHAPHAPRLHAIDLLNHPTTTAGRVQDVVERLGLERFLALHLGDFRGMSAAVASTATPLDFVWFDCGGPAEYVDFLAEYWDLVAETGGVLVLHMTLHDPAIGDAVLHDLRSKQARHPGAIEMLSLCEPHKVTQASFTMVRKTARFRAPVFTRADVLRDAHRLLEIDAARA
jgi:predicted O-methyltransferase YrrM